MIQPLRHTPLLAGTLQNLFYPPAKDEYTYFARAAEKPFPKCGSLVKAAWAMDASMLVYAKYSVRPVDGKTPDKFAVAMPEQDLDDNFQRAGLSWERIGNWEAHGTQGLFAACPEFAILAFRGTEADDPLDVASDASLALVTEAGYCEGVSGQCKVHQGFRNALDSVWDEVQAKVHGYIKECPGKEICFTGHSLGAALALLASTRFCDANISVYTFGCPRVGDDAFAQRAISFPGREMYRFVNYNDVVTHVPARVPILLPYCQAPKRCYRFAAEGVLHEIDDDSFEDDAFALSAAIATLCTTLEGLRVVTKQDLSKVMAPASVVDHSPARYCFRLWDCV